MQTYRPYSAATRFLTHSLSGLLIQPVKLLRFSFPTPPRPTFGASLRLIFRPTDPPHLKGHHAVLVLSHFSVLMQRTGPASMARGKARFHLALPKIRYIYRPRFLFP